MHGEARSNGSAGLAVGFGLLHGHPASAMQAWPGSTARTSAQRHSHPRAVCATGMPHLPAAARLGLARLLREQALARQPRPGGNDFHRGSAANGCDPDCRRLGLMTDVAPFFLAGMLNPRALLRAPAIGARRPTNHFVVLSLQSGLPLPSRLRRRRYVRALCPLDARRLMAHGSSGLNDQTHVDRCHPRGRNPRGGAGR